MGVRECIHSPTPLSYSPPNDLLENNLYLESSKGLGDAIVVAAVGGHKYQV